jgi:hypothetical protein
MTDHDYQEREIGMVEPVEGGWSVTTPNGGVAIRVTKEAVMKVAGETRCGAVYRSGDAWHPGIQHCPRKASMEAVDEDGSLFYTCKQHSKSAIAERLTSSTAAQRAEKSRITAGYRLGQVRLRLEAIVAEYDAGPQTTVRQGSIVRTEEIIAYIKSGRE